MVEDMTDKATTSSHPSGPMREPANELRENAAPAIGASPVAGLIRVVTAPWGERVWLRVYCIAIAMAVFLSAIGALGTDHTPLGIRLGYWLLVMLGGTVATQATALLIDRFVRLEPLFESIALFVVSMPVLIVVIWGLSALYNGQPFHPADMRFFIAPVTVITLAMSGLHYVLNRAPRQSHVFVPAHTADERQPAELLRQRLPFKYREADILALSAEDHYLRIHTSAGEALILMRLYDAIAALDGIEGSQTHRSWWVAKSAIADIKRTDGRLSLILKGGAIAPVSRTYQKALRDWL